MSLTTDPTDPRLGHGIDETPRPQQETYLVLSEAERATGFVRPLRKSYKHVGPPGPAHPLLDLDEEQQRLFGGYGYVKFERYPEGTSAAEGCFWTQTDLDKVGKGCGAVTTMGDALCETYARNPKFYGATYCTGCNRHRPVNEFIWVEDGERVGS